MGGIPEERRRNILELVAARHQVTVNELARQVRASRETIRRDLGELEKRGLLRKVHGGAVDTRMAIETAFGQRVHQHIEEKRRIARAAAARFRSGDTLFVDAGTTTAVFAEELAQVGGITVITNSLMVASKLWAGRRDGQRVYLLGGQYDGEVCETLGPAVIEQINSYRADHAVLTVGAIDAVAGVMDFSPDEANVAKAMSKNARSITVLADYSKLGRLALAHVCPLSSIQVLITDRAPAPALATAFTSSGIEVVIA